MLLLSERMKFLFFITAFFACPNVMPITRKTAAHPTPLFCQPHREATASWACIAGNFFQPLFERFNAIFQIVDPIWSFLNAFPNGPLIKNSQQIFEANHD